MVISLNETYINYLLEDDPQVSSTKDVSSISNKFRTKPQGVIIQDSYNNPFFPITPRPRLDTSKADILEVFLRYRELYSPYKGYFLPWHFCVEMINDRYLVFNTRPLDMKFPLTNEETSTHNYDRTNWDNTVKKFIDVDKIFDISEMIHICIIGDSTIDVYTRKIYELIGRTCIIPILRQYKLPMGVNERIFQFNLSSRFNIDYVMKFVKK